MFTNRNGITPAFYKDITETVKEYQNYNSITGGNWNLILEPQLVMFINVIKINK